MNANRLWRIICHAYAWRKCDHADYCAMWRC
jgi:hypothetical protein